MLRIDRITPAEQDWLNRELPEGEPTEEEVKRVADRLVDRILEDSDLAAQAEGYVKRTLNLRRVARTQQEAAEANRNYRFATLAPSSTPQHPVYRQVTVYLKDFQAFCEVMGLSEKHMLQVAHGEVASYKGWRQGYTAGSAGTPRAKVLEQKRTGPLAGISGPFFTVVKGQGSWDAPAAPVFLPPVTWRAD